MINDIWLTDSVRQVKLNEDGESLIESVKIESVIDELGIRYEDVLNPSLIVFVEGKDDPEFLKHLGVTGPRIKIIFSDGLRKIQCFAFIKIISSENVKNKFLIIADNDGETPEDRKEHVKKEVLNQFRNPPTNLPKELDNQIFVFDKYSIESYFLNQDTIEKSFTDIDPEKIKTFLSEYEDVYKKKLKNLRNGELEKNNFRQYMKPKIIFEKYRHDKFEEAYKEFWKGNDTFLEIKEKIAIKSEEIGRSGNKWFPHVLSNLSTSDPELQRLVETIQKQLKE